MDSPAALHPKVLERQSSKVIEKLASGLHEMQTVADQIYAEPEMNNLTDNQVVVEATITDKPALLRSSHPEPGWIKACRKYLDKPKTPAQQIHQDKLTFVLGLANLMLTSFLFAFPKLFMKLFLVKSMVLLGSRWLVYRLKNWHYYLLEYCYVAISLGLIQSTLFPSSPGFHKLVFSLMAGVLTGAVIATKNSFVLHSIDKITSLFQHLTPALVAWLMRWRTDRIVPGFRDLGQQQQKAFTSAGFYELTILPMGVWLIWAACYYVLVFVLAGKKVQERSYATMFALQTKNPNSSVSKLIFRFKNKHQQYLMYLAIHGLSCFVGMVLNNFWFHSCLLHTAFVLTVLCVSMWNGASYNFEVFAKRYIQSLGAEPSEEKSSKPAKSI